MNTSTWDCFQVFVFTIILTPSVIGLLDHAYVYDSYPRVKKI
jgi:hypothetical protein